MPQTSGADTSAARMEAYRSAMRAGDAERALAIARRPLPATWPEDERDCGALCEIWHGWRCTATRRRGKRVRLTSHGTGGVRRRLRYHSDRLQALAYRGLSLGGSGLRGAR